MSSPLSENAWSALRCPNCRCELRRTSEGAECGACGSLYPCQVTHAIDLRLRKAKVVQHEYVIGAPLAVPAGINFRELREKRVPDVDFGDVPVPFHLTRALMSHFPRAARAGDLALDLGCGATVHRQVCEAAGFEYLGLDYHSEAAQVWADAHALPFADASFGFVLSIAVLEHIRFPFVMMREVRRVLRPGGIFIGTVAFLEPFHDDSYYHHSHLGALNSLHEGGFEIEQIAPSVDWNALTAQGAMGLFAKMPGLLVRGLLWPLQMLHRLWWLAARLVSADATEDARIRNLTGAFSFVARRPAVDNQ